MHFLRVGRKQGGSQDSDSPAPSFLLFASLASVARMLSCNVRGGLLTKQSILPFVPQARGFVSDLSEKKQRYETLPNHRHLLTYQCY